jgi:hypothetical protein
MKIISNRYGVEIKMNDDEFKTLKDLVIRGRLSARFCSLSEDSIKKKDIFDIFNLIEIK